MLARAHTFTIEGLQTRHVASRSTSAAACPRSRSSGSPTRPCARRASASARRSSTPATSSRRGASRRTSRPATCRRPAPRSISRSPARVLAASGQLSGEPLERVALFGELALDGRVRPCRGTLAVAQAAARAASTR